MLFTDLAARKVVADFSGGTLSTDAGALLLRQVDANLGLTQSLAQCFDDGRNQDLGRALRAADAGPTHLRIGPGL